MNKALMIALVALAYGASAQNAFRVTPYVQHPAPTAMTLKFLTTENSKATVSWWPQGNAGASQSAEISPRLAEELQYYGDKHDKQYLPVMTPWQYRYRIEGLKPDTVYGYKVELEGGASYAKSFRTAPDLNRPIRFVCYSDCETEPASNGSAVTWDNFAQDQDTNPSATSRKYFVDQTVGYASNICTMVSRKPDFFVIAGDLAQTGSCQTHWDEFWRHNAGALNDPAGSIPILAALGNHEYSSYSANAGGTAQPGEQGALKYLSYFEFEPNGANVDADQQQRFHRMDYGPVALIFIDPNNGPDNEPPEGTKWSWEWEYGHPHERDTNAQLYEHRIDGGVDKSSRVPQFQEGSAQYRWLEEQLADAQTNKLFTFLVCHQCPFSAGYHGRASGEKGRGVEEENLSGVPTRCLTNLVFKYGVDGWICGHDEMYEHSQVQGEETLPDGTKRPMTLNVWDVGIGGDGLRGCRIAANPNPYEVFRAHVDAPEVYDNGDWQTGTLVSGGKHYGHLEVNVDQNAEGLWTATLTPVYNFVSKNAQTGALTFERRTYPDEVVVTNRPFSAEGERTPDGDDSGDEPSDPPPPEEPEDDTVIYVSPTGDGTAPHRGYETGYASIQDAIDAAEAGDVVQLAAGTHYVPKQITIDKGITVRGVRASATIIRPSAVGVKLFLLKHADAVLSDVTLTGVSASGFCVVEINAPGGTLQDAIITDNSATGSGNGNACVGTRGAGGVIRRCKFTDNMSTSAYGTLQIYDSPRVECCLFTGNKATWGAGIYIQNSGGRAFITHVTAYGNTSSSDPTHDDFYDYNSSIKNVYNCCFAEAYTVGSSVYRGCHFGEPTEENLKGKGVVVDGDATVDLDGVAFDPDAPSIGCYALRDDVVAVEWNSGSEVTAGEEFTASPIVSNLPEGASVVFDLYDAFGARAGGSATGEEFTFTAPNHGGWCTLVTTVTTEGGTVNTITLQSVLFIGVLDVQVTKSGAGESMTDVIAAFGVCASGATMTVHDGEYEIPQTLTLDKPLTIRSANGRNTVTFKSSNPAKTIVALNHPEAKVDGLTFTGNTSAPAVKIGTNGGTVDNSQFTQNLGGNHGTAITTESPAAVVRRTLFAQNKGNWGSVYVKNGGLFESCLFYGNQASYGGGVYIEKNFGSALSEQTRFLNCTFADNKADSAGCADLYDYRGGNVFVNTVIKDANMNNGALVTNCVVVKHVGSFGTSVNVSTVEPVFVDTANGNYLPVAGSPLIDAGAALEGLAETDVYGRNRLSGEAIDIGAAEVPADELAVDLSCDFARRPFEEGLSATVVPVVAGGAGATLAWTVTRQDGVVAAAVETGVEPFVFAIPGPGAYSVHVVATLDDQAATNDCANPIVAGAQELYVDENGGNVYPFATPETAARDFNLAWAMVCSGAVVRVAAGHYETAKSLDLTDPIQLIGAGRDATVIRLKSGVNGRVALVDNAESVIRGCTLTGGRLGFPEGQLGVGVKFGDHGGLVEDCHITDNSYDTVMQHGAVAFTSQSRGCIRRSVIDFNKTKGWGGGIYFSGASGCGGSVVDCLVCSNSAAYGGAAYVTGLGYMTNCTLAANHASNYGTELIFYGGYPNTRFVNVAIKPKTDATDGWNSFWLAGGTTKTNGIEKVLVHCALAGFYGETYEKGDDGKFISKSFPPPAESGNLAMVPAFVDDAHGNYRLPVSSSLRDGGLYEPWMRNMFDLDGQPLAVPGQAPIGCYAKPKKGLTLWVR